jgi:hypothetical protein
MEIELHPDAGVEFIEASQWYESRVPGLGTPFIDEFEGLKEVLRRRSSSESASRLLEEEDMTHNNGVDRASAHAAEPTRVYRLLRFRLASASSCCVR